MLAKSGPHLTAQDDHIRSQIQRAQNATRAKPPRHGDLFWSKCSFRCLAPIVCRHITWESAGNTSDASTSRYGATRPCLTFGCPMARYQSVCDAIFSFPAWYNHHSRVWGIARKLASRAARIHRYTCDYTLWTRIDEL